MSRFSAGSLADGYANFAGFAALNDASTARWGLIQFNNGAYLVKGRVIFGMNSGGSDAAVEFVDSNKVLFIQDVQKVSANFNRFEVRHASSLVTMTSISIRSLSTVSPGRWQTVAGAVTKTACVFTAMDTFTYGSSDTLTRCTYNQCKTVTTGGATFNTCTFNQPTATPAVSVSSPANAAKISGSTFISTGTGHGLTIGGAVADITLTNDTWTGYAASDGSTGNEAVYVNTSAGSMTINIVGGTRPSVRAAAGVNLTINSGVALTVTVKDIITGSLINVARVLAKVAAGGDLPFEETVTSINRSGSTATVAHTGHGLSDGKKVLIQGATEQEYNGVFVLTKINDDSYSYTVSGTPSTPAGGTIKATAVIIDGDTSSGVITDTRDYTASQPVTGIVRKGSASPYYASAPFSGTISTSGGLSVTVLMIPDE